MQHNAAFFDAMFEIDQDPWRVKSRWYESRKRAMTLACLPAERYVSAYEPGCANGELSAALAPRCERLLVTDGSRNAVDLARVRLANFPNVAVQQAWLPQQWPIGVFDLIVLSEFGFYLNSQDLEGVAAATLATLGPDGTVLACHWRHPVAGCQFDGDAVNRLLAQRLALPLLTQLWEADFRIDVWCRNPDSVARREGFA